MATLRPSLHSSGSYQRTRSPAPPKNSLQPQQEEPRARSRSRSRNPKPYDPDSPKRYRPNESRSRKPPQSPKVEDGGSGDDGVRMRGKLEQKPVIIDLDSKGEPLPFKASQEPAPATPPSSDDSYSDSESDILSDSPQPTKKAIPPSFSNGTAKPTRESEGPSAEEKSRRRPARPSIDTGFQQYGSLPAQLPQIERARSPYVSTPRERKTEDPRRFSEEATLSLAPLNSTDPGTRPRYRSQQPPDLEHRRHGDHGSGSGSGSEKDKGRNSHQKTARPVLDRRASAMPQLESEISKIATSQRSRGQYYSSSDNSEGEGRHRQAKSGQQSPESKTKFARRSVGDGAAGDKQKSEERQSHPDRPSPPRSATATEFHKWGQSLNREALLNVSAALLGAGAAVDSHQRKASPRPTPQISPNHSPYPSPPRTPPDPHQHRGNPVSNLKNDSPKSNSRPGSPLSSRPPSPKRVGSDHMSSRGEQELRQPRYSHQAGPEMKPRPPYPSEAEAKPAHVSSQGSQDTRPAHYMPRSRATSPLPPTRRAEPEPPKIDIRSPSPLPQRAATHSGMSVPDKREARTPSRYMPAYAGGATLQPARPDRRQRSLSNADARGSRPTNLTINPIARPVIHQSDVEYLSPTSENTPPHFHSSPQHMYRPSLLNPTSTDGRARTSSLAEAGSSHRSRSTVSGDDAAAPRASSAVPPPGSRHRSRSSVSVPQRALSDQSTPGALPLCPRPDPVSGYNDWYTLEGCESFAMCPDCRNTIFGSGYERFFRLRSTNQPSKKTLCQMNDPWIRMATISSITSKQPDVTFLTRLATIGEDYEPCPGPKPAERDWYRVEDEHAAEDDHLADFQVCTHCVHSIEIILPTLKGTFFRYKGHQVDTTPRPCSLRFDPKRFAQYVDKCEKSAQEAARNRKEPDMSDFVWFHKKETVISECTREHALIGRDWHLSALIPELAICEMCYYDTVRPLSTPPNSYHLAKAVSPVPKHISNDVSCQLYSPRMKEIFERACREDDAEYLKQAVLTRRKLQVEILAARMAVQQRPDDWKVQKELDDFMDNWRRLEKKRH